MAFFSCKYVNLNNKISPQHHNIYTGISSRSKSEVSTILMTTGLTSPTGLLNLFFLDSFAVIIDFYCVKLVYFATLANLWLIIQVHLGPVFRNSLCDLLGANVGQCLFFANSLNLLLCLYGKKISLKD